MKKHKIQKLQNCMRVYCFMIIYYGICTIFYSVLGIGTGYLSAYVIQLQETSGSIRQTKGTSVALDFEKHVFIKKPGEMTITKHDSSETTFALIKCNELKQMTHTESLHQPFNYTWNDGTSWIPLDEYLYIVNSDTTTLSYKITMEVATTNSNTLGQVIMFEDEDQYHTYQQTQVVGDNSQIINIKQQTQSVEFNFTKEHSYYFIIVQAQPGISVTSLWGVRNGMRALYSTSEVPTTACSRSNKCYIEYQEGDCVLMKTETFTKLEYVARLSSYWLYIAIGGISGIFWCCICNFCAIMMGVCTYSESTKQTTRYSLADDETVPILRACSDEAEFAFNSSEPYMCITNNNDEYEVNSPDMEQGYTTINQIINVLVPIIEFNCYYFGYCLNIPERKLNKLTMRHSTDNKDLMMRILLSWSEVDGRVSWGKVVQALNKSGQSQLADMIKKCYINNDTEMSSMTDYIVNVQVITTLDTPPTEKEFLERVATKIQTKWFLFGMLLSIGKEKLDCIKLSSDTPVIQFMDVFDHWKRSKCAPFTWNKVIDVLRSDTLCENALADTLTNTLQAQIV